MVDLSSSHGTYIIKIESNGIYTELFDMFNESGVQKWVNEMKHSIKQFSGAPFTLLVNEQAAKGATPEALAIANQYNEWLNQQKLIAKAVIYGAEIFKQIDITHLPARQQQNVRFFDKCDLARQWLKQEKALYLASV